MEELGDPARVEALKATGLLEGQDEVFQRLVDQVADVLQAPAAVISLVAGDRQRFVASRGLPEPVSDSFCRDIVETGDALVVEDARREELGVASYAGIPLVSSDGHVLGAICAIDTEPRAWTERELKLLRVLAESAVRELELRRASDEAIRARATAESQSLVLERITGGDRLPDVLELLVRTIEARSEGMLGSILLLDAEGRHLTHGAAPSLPPSYTEAIDGIEIGPTAGSCGTAAYEGRQVVVTDVATDPLWEEYRELAAEHGLAACWSTPIRSSEGTVLGTFALYYHEPRRPSAYELELIEEAVRLASVAIERGRMLARHAYDALHDPLTGLANRALLEDRLQHALAAARRSGGRVAVLFIDLNGFKEINDTRGHEAGDRALYAAGRRLLGAVRPSDTVGRWGGDEFVMAIENVAGREQVEHVIARVNHALSVEDDGEQAFSASIGVSLSGEGADTPASLLEQADRAMYRAKAEARGEG